MCELSADISAGSADLKQMRLSTLCYCVSIWLGVTAEEKRPALGSSDLRHEPGAWQPTPGLLPGESPWTGSLAGHGPWGRNSRTRLSHSSAQHVLGCLGAFALLLVETQGALILLCSVQQGAVSEKFKGFGGIARLEHKVQKIDVRGSTCISTQREREAQ